MRSQIIESIKRIVLENTENGLISLYLIGSFLTKEIVGSSDIDLIGVMKPSFDFRKENIINKILNEKVNSRHKIDLGTMSYEEFFGGEQKGSLMKHIDLPIFMNFLKNAKLIYGKKLNFGQFPIKPASAKDEMKYHIKTFNRYKNKFRKKDRVASDFCFRDFIKIVLYIANLELQITMKTKPKKSYAGIVNAFKIKKNHVAHHSLKLRKQKIITIEERKQWLDIADLYVKGMKKFI